MISVPPSAPLIGRKLSLSSEECDAAARVTRTRKARALSRSLRWAERRYPPTGEEAYPSA